MKEIKMLLVWTFIIIWIGISYIAVQTEKLQELLNEETQLSYEQMESIDLKLNLLEQRTYTTLVPLGTFRISYYCNNCDKCGTNNTTTDGTELENGMQSVATDPNIIPSGTVLQIDGKQYIANDTGGKVQGNDIDIMIYGKPHEEVLAMGIDHFVVYAVEKVR